MNQESNKPPVLILASGSPRRRQLLSEAGFTFEVRTVDVEETYPETLRPQQVAEYLAKKKNEANRKIANIGEVIITSDTTVVLENEVLGKPQDELEAKNMLQKLANQWHEVISGVAISSSTKYVSFSEETRVLLAPLAEQEINYYIHQFTPYDKAGAYGIQEWIGRIAVERIEGSYDNVIGLPVQRVYQTLVKEFNVLPKISLE